MNDEPHPLYVVALIALVILLFLCFEANGATDLSDKTWTDRCDVVEWQHFGSEFQSKQVIFWVGESGKRCVMDWRWWPKDYEPSPIIRWTDERGVRRCVVGKIHYETWDTVDREVENQRVLPCTYRVKLREAK